MAKPRPIEPPSTSLFTPGRLLILLANAFYSLGAFAADYNTTHVFNPNWPPHAKFHNGQTMSLGVLLALTSLTFVYKSLTPRAKGAEGAREVKENLWWAAVMGSLYCVAGLSAIWYPGTAWADPEFWVEGQVTQFPVFLGQVVMVWTGYAVEVWRMGG